MNFFFALMVLPFPLFLKNYSEYAGVGANWLMFGTSQVESVPPGLLMIEVLTKCSKDDCNHNKHIKSIIQPKYVTGCPCPHFFDFIPGKYHVDENFNPIYLRYATENFSGKKIRINHYFTRTEDFLEQENSSEETISTVPQQWKD